MTVQGLIMNCDNEEEALIHPCEIRHTPKLYWIYNMAKN
jgi:hypothetical protein